jgi:hypothetical protein
LDINSKQEPAIAKATKSSIQKRNEEEGTTFAAQPPPQADFAFGLVPSKIAFELWLEHCNGDGSDVFIYWLPKNPIAEKTSTPK